MAERYVALLRGVNVVGKNKVPMKQLASLFEAAGCTRVQTYIATGNVVFRASKKLARAVPTTVPAAMEAQFGFGVAILLRSASHMRTLVEGNPFVAEGRDKALLHVMFLADAPGAVLIASLDANRSPGDEFRVLGQEAYLHLPRGVAESKLNNAFFDSKLRTVSTGRNWRTVNPAGNGGGVANWMTICAPAGWSGKVSSATRGSP